MKRKEFPTKIKVARYRFCGAKCESCGISLTLIRWQCDHANPDGMTGKPTFENARCLCLGCHAAKTAIDVAVIAKAKRREARHLGAVKPKGQLKSRGFAKKPRAHAERQPVPRKGLYT